MTTRKDDTGSGIAGLGDLLKQSLAKRGGLPPKPSRSPRPGGVRKPSQCCGGRRRD